ncbi:MAG: sensor histidine kinase [Herpetosiphon sp.]
MHASLVHRLLAETTRQTVVLREALAELRVEEAASVAESDHLAQLLGEAQLQQQLLRFQHQPETDVTTKLEELEVRRQNCIQQASLLDATYTALTALLQQSEHCLQLLAGNPTAEAAAFTSQLEARSFNAREDERSRLETTLHGGPAQLFAFLVMGLEHGLTLARSAQPARLQAHLTELRDAGREGLHDIKRVLAELRRPEWHGRDLLDGLQELVDRWNETAGHVITFNRAAVPQMPPFHTTALYRLVQDALANAVKYAPRAPIIVAILPYAHDLEIKVTDKGPGFDPNGLAARTGQQKGGISRMHQAAAALGASFQLRSTLGEGTEICVTVPTVTGRLALDSALSSKHDSDK